MTDKHTPGEWIIKYQTNIVSQDTGRLVANCGGHQHSHVDQGPENQANAARIVAMNRSYDALLAACKAVETWWLAEGREGFNGAPACMFDLRAAIALAEAPQ